MFYLNTIYRRSSSAIGRLLKSALSWTFSNLGFSTDELTSLDKNTATLEPARLVNSYCYNPNSSDWYTIDDTSKFDLKTYDLELRVNVRFPVGWTANSYRVITGKMVIGAGTNDGKWGLLSDQDLNGIVFAFQPMGESAIITPTIPEASFADGLFHEIYVILDRSGNLDIFLDDVQVGSSIDVSTHSTNDLVNNTTSLAIGATDAGSIQVPSKCDIYNTYIKMTDPSDDSIKQESRYTLAEGSVKYAYDVIGGEHLVVSASGTGLGLYNTQDDFNYNEIYGADRYTDDATGLLEIYVPYVAGVPVVASIVSYTKQSSHPAGTYNNGVETKWILGATTFDTGDQAWNVDALVQAADTEHILHDVTTSYGIAQSYDDMIAERGNYLFIDVSTEYQYKNMLLFTTPPEGLQAVGIHRYVNNGDNLITDVNGDYVYDLNNYPVWSSE